MGLKRSFDMVGDVQHIVFELLFEWGFAKQNLACVEFIARLDRYGRDMAVNRLLQVRRPTFPDPTAQPALWNTFPERMCWAFDRCHVCGGRAHLHNKNTGNPQTGELYTISVCFACTGNLLEMAVKREDRRYRSYRIDDDDETREGIWEMVLKSYLTVVAAPTTKNRLLQLGDGDLDCVFETWRPEGVKHKQLIFHYEKGDDCKLSKTLRDHSATALYRHELDRRNIRERRAVQHLADLSNATEDVGFPTSINGFHSSSDVWNLASNDVVPWLSRARLRHPGVNPDFDDASDDTDASDVEYDDTYRNMLNKAVNASKYVIGLIQGFRSKAVAYQIAFNCDERQTSLLVLMATTCAFSLQVISVQEWVRRSHPATHRPIHVVQAVLIASSSSPVPPSGYRFEFPRKPVHIRIVLKQRDFEVAFPGISPVPGKTPIPLISERIQWEPIVCLQLMRNVLERLTTSLAKVPSKAALARKKQKVNLECSHSYKSPRRFYRLRSCSSCCCPDA
jgi:hypothetical protein